ncbi:hypothetical protein VTI74DRAFT_11654 [Chaetomium olivicolor]
MNGIHKTKPLNRADEIEHLIDAVKALIIPYIRAADEAVPSRAAGKLLPNVQGLVQNALVNARRPVDLVQELALCLPKGEGRCEEGLLEAIKDVLKYSLNTWDKGFIDKLYVSTNPVGVVSELLLGVLNTNVHPASSASRVPAGRITCQGGSYSNLTSIVIAPNTLYPECTTQGNSCSPGPFILFTSVHVHYSVEKAAVTYGLGSSSLWTMPVDATGRMDPSALRTLIQRAKSQGQTPL